MVLREKRAEAGALVLRSTPTTRALRGPPIDGPGGAGRPAGLGGRSHGLRALLRFRSDGRNGTSACFADGEVLAPPGRKCSRTLRGGGPSWLAGSGTDPGKHAGLPGRWHALAAPHGTAGFRGQGPE